MIAKNRIDAYFKKKGYNDSLSNLAEWISIEDIMETYQMTERGIHIFVSRYAIPKKRMHGKVYYSKQHIDILKNKK